MKVQEVLDPQHWAERTFGSVRLKDMRRTRRAVIAARQMARDATASLPQQMQTWKEVKALYRLLDEPDVTFEALMHPHWQQTRANTEAETVVLLVQDTTEIDLSHRAHFSGIGQIGNAKGRGFLLQTVLAVVPETRSVLGCLAQKPFVRIPAPPKEQRYQRRHRENRESDVWMEMVKQIGPCRRSRSRYVPLLSRMPEHSDALSRQGGSESQNRGSRGGDWETAGSGPCLAK